MPIPTLDALRAAVLHVLADGAEHSSKEIQGCMKLQFEITPIELQRKNKKGISVFRNNIALALAHLQGAPHGGSKAIEWVRGEVYKITEHGKAILTRNPSDLTIKDLLSREPFV